MSYNGWSNYETWCVGLWLDNEESAYEYWRERAQQIVDHPPKPEYEWQTGNRLIVWALAEEMKDIVEDMKPLTSEASMYSDLLNAALSEVDWHELAEHYLDGIEATL